MIRKLLLLAFLCLPATAYGQTILSGLVGPPPAPNTLDFLRWENRAEEAILALCPIDRSAKIYVDAAGGASSGNDGNAGTIGAPFATLARAQTYITSTYVEAPSGLTIYLNRDDEWNEAAGLDLNKSYITVTSYGSGTKRPFLNWFTNKWAIDGVDDWTLATGTSYTRASGGTNLAEIRSQTDRLRGLTRCSSDAEVDATPYSYRVNGAAIRMNVGVDPDTIAWEYILTTATQDSGIISNSTANYCRVHDVRLDGWGYTRLNTRQDYGVCFGGNGSTIFACTDTECYFNDRHCFGHNGGGAGGNSGGLSLWRNIRAGYCSQQDCTVFIAYCGGGLQEFITSGCTIAYGALADYNARPIITGSGTDKAYACGTAAYAHTNGTAFAFGLFLNTAVPADDIYYQGCSIACQFGNQPTTTTMEGFRAYEIGTRMAASKGTGNGYNSIGPTMRSGQLIGQSSVYNANCYWGLEPCPMGAETLISTNGQDFCRLYNCIVDLNLWRIPNSVARFSLYNPTTDLTSSVAFAHSLVRLRNPNLLQFHINYDQTFPDATTTSNAAGSFFKNSVASYDRNDLANATAMRLGLVDSATELVNNAYWLVSAGSGANLNGIANTVAPVFPGGPVSTEASATNVQLIGKGVGGLVEYDMTLRPRHPTAPTIGPYEYYTDALIKPAVSDFVSGIWKADTASMATGIGDRVKRLPAVDPGAAGGLLQAGVNAATTVDITGNLSGSVGSVQGDTKQTGDTFVRLGAPTDTSISKDINNLVGDISVVQVDTDDIKVKLPTNDVRIAGGLPHMDVMGPTSVQVPRSAASKFRIVVTVRDENGQLVDPTGNTVSFAWSDPNGGSVPAGAPATALRQSTGLYFADFNVLTSQDKRQALSAVITSTISSYQAVSIYSLQFGPTPPTSITVGP